MKIVGKTDIGRVRESNQDAFQILALGQGAGLALVCDGMGGVSGGDIASALARDEITAAIQQAFFDEMDSRQIQELVADAIGRANETVYALSCRKPELSGMGTTVVLALINGVHAVAAHVGDSRLYHFHEGVLTQLTRDHSWVQDLVDRGSITQEEADVHPQKNMITRALGIGRELVVDFLSLDLVQGDKLLLCSDGLTNLCPLEKIQSLMADTQDEETVEALIREANEGGGYDNITAVIIEND